MRGGNRAAKVRPSCTVLYTTVLKTSFVRTSPEVVDRRPDSGTHAGFRPSLVSYQICGQPALCALNCVSGLGCVCSPRDRQTDDLRDVPASVDFRLTMVQDCALRQVEMMRMRRQGAGTVGRERSRRYDYQSLLPAWRRTRDRRTNTACDCEPHTGVTL